MIIDHDTRAGWRERWLASIREFSDLPQQRRTWLNPQNTNPHFSFVEWTCCYFDDLHLSNLESYAGPVAEGLVTLEEAEAVWAFHATAHAYQSPGGDDYDHEAILGDPAWLAVATEALLAIDRLLCLIQEPAEREILLEKSNGEALRASRILGQG